MKHFLTHMRVMRSMMGSATGLVLSLLLAASIYPSGTALAQQVVDLESEDYSSNHGVRFVFSFTNSIPGGQGFGLAVGFDTVELDVARGVKIIPSIDVGTSYNIDIDDPDVKHLLKVGAQTKLRIAVDLTQPGWVTSVEAIPWFGVSVNGCWSIHETRESNLFARQADGWQLCYGPTLGLDVSIGSNMMLSFGIETLFFTLGQSGFPNSPFFAVGQQVGVGYNVKF